MIEKTIYVAYDGTEFSNKADCVSYEKAKKEINDNIRRAKESHNKDVINEVQHLCCDLWEEYIGEKIDDKPSPDIAYIWLESNITSILLKVNATMQDIVCSIGDNIYGDEILAKLNLKKIQREVDIRKDWANALKNVKHGSDLSHKVGYGFSKEDVSELAKLHRANKHRKKIEDLLTDCNFHSECGDFMNKRYGKYI